VGNRQAALVLRLVGGMFTVAAFPWTIRLPGRDSLDGSWIGEVRSNRGPQAWLFLSLRPSRDYRIARRSRVSCSSSSLVLISSTTTQSGKLAGPDLIARNDVLSHQWSFATRTCRRLPTA
jgi:hypothetical protein